MKQLNSRVIKERSVRLSSVFRESLRNINIKWKGWEGEVLLLHSGEKQNQAFGRNLAYKNVFVDNYKEKYGKFVNVKIERVKGFNLFGTLVI
jgi:tRNA A37 methylthiotransferase MiaB